MIRVLLADDHKIVREGFRAILARAGDIEIVAEARDGQAAIRLAQELAPDVVLMDIAMPGCNGIEATRRVQSGPAAPRIGHGGARGLCGETLPEHDHCPVGARQYVGASRRLAPYAPARDEERRVRWTSIRYWHR